MKISGYIGGWWVRINIGGDIISFYLRSRGGKKRAIYLLGKPGRHEWHLKRIAVRMKGVERIRADGAQHGEHPSAELTANCNKTIKLLNFYLKI